MPTYPSSVADPGLVAAWVAARSVARNLPAPVAERGGQRVEVHNDKEIRRWVFPAIGPGLVALAYEITEPRNFLKVCAAPGELAAWLPSPASWRVDATGPSYMMTTDRDTPAAMLPLGYRLETHAHGPTLEARILAPGGPLAASGFAVEAAGVYVFDRIATEPAHQRRGLGWVVMATLDAARREPGSRRVLVATVAGRRLYESLGWTVHAPYASASLVEVP